MRLRRPSAPLIRVGLCLALVAGLVVAGANVAKGQAPPANVDVAISAWSGIKPGLTVTAGPNSAPQVFLKAAAGQPLGFTADKWVYYDGYSCFAFGGWDVSVNLGSWTSTPGIGGTMAANYTVPASLPSGEPVTRVNLDAWYYWIDCSLT